MNARFTDFINGSPVRVTLTPERPALDWYSGRRAHEEGWSSELVAWHLVEGEVIRTSTTDGRDCDGRLTQTYVCSCPLSDLRATPADEYGPARPRWNRENAHQRDEYAEAAGY